MALTKIKMVRLQRGLRQWDVAREVGIAESHLSKIETGRVKPDARTLEKIAAVLSVSVVSILGDEGALNTQGNQKLGNENQA